MIGHAFETGADSEKVPLTRDMDDNDQHSFDSPTTTDEILGTDFSGKEQAAGRTLAVTQLHSERDEFDENRGSAPRMKMKQLLQIPSVRNFSIYIMIYIGTAFMPAVFLAAYGAEFFAHCTAKDRGDDDCELDYVSWQFHYSLFQSLRGVVSFLFTGFVGRSSDAYGRKSFLAMHLVLSCLPYIPLLFGRQYLWWFFVLGLFAGLNGSNASATPIMTAYLADILPESERTLGYGLVYSCAGTGLFAGASLAVLIGAIFSDYAIIVAMVCFYIVGLVYVYYRVPESLTVDKRKPLKTMNPFRPLMQTADNGMVLWISVVQFMISLPETGILDNIIAFILDQLKMDNEKSANLIAVTYIISFGLGLVGSNLYLLPFLRNKLEMEDLSILFFGALTISVSLMCTALIAFIPSVFMVVLSAGTMSVGLLAYPAANGILTRYLNQNEQGLGFGTVFAWRGVTFILAPFTFGAIYSVTKPKNMSWFAASLASVLCLTALPVIHGPLRRTMHKYDRMKARAVASGVPVSRLQAMSVANHLEVLREVEVDSDVPLSPYTVASAQSEEYGDSVEFVVTAEDLNPPQPLPPL